MEFLLLMALAGWLIWMFRKKKKDASRRQLTGVDRNSRHYSMNGELPLNRNRLLKGFWWHRPPLLALTAGRGFNTEVVGESYRLEVLEKIVGGYGQYGCTFHCTAQLALPQDMPDHPKAVAVLIDTNLVGFIPSSESKLLKSELETLAGAEGGVTCKAVIVGGWDQSESGGSQGYFGVKLSLSRPLKVRKS